MTQFIIRRLVQMIPLLFGITFLTFALINLIPGSPIQRFEFDPRARPQDIENIRRNLGLDKPWPLRYVYWVRDAVQGNLGYSLINAKPVTDRIVSRIPNTLILTATSLLIALLFSMPLGIYAAVKRNSWFDHLVNVGSTAVFAIPTFWLGLLMIILFSVKFKEWGLPSMPASGTHDFRGGGGFFDRLEHLIMPAVALALVQLAGWTRYVRSSMLEVIRQDFVRTAEAKGLRDKSVLYVHAFRNAILPLITLMGLTLPDLFAGAFFIEVIFAWNGLGRLTVDALNQRDYTLIMGVFTILSFLTLLGNLLADVLYAVFDPRIRY
ncbi:MAG: peptide/nickel transport system permease protein [Thermomicrobiales bacterium]|nr:peptide/nickel transport system permease protein [Thermomicrobiales bacterium]MEA2582022.1 peptide/nickel transport system permease protein [Thermomicrobiales bacterium]